MGGRQAYIEAVESLRTAAKRPSEDAARAVVDRAVGLLAGRTRCRLTDAHRHLLRMSAEQCRDLADVAAGVISLLDVPEHRSDGAALLVPPYSSPTPGPSPASDPSLAPGSSPAAGLVRRPEAWQPLVQAVLDAMPGQHALLIPVRDHAGRLADLEFAATSPEATAADGRHGRSLIGTRISSHFPQTLVSGRWLVYERVLDTGEPAEIGPFEHAGNRYSVRAYRLGPGLLVTWEQHGHRPVESDRIAATERLGNLGWGEWNLVSGEVRWSEQLYRIYERDPALGPLAREESEALALAEDLPLRMAAAEAFQRGEQVDVTTRVRVNGRIKHLRSVVDAVRDASGGPLRIFGIVQDVTARETSVQRLAEVEHQLAEQRRSLAAEHELASRLQQIILPIPDGAVALPGLKVAVRYLPAEQEGMVGGDWFHAAALRDGSVLLAVGDVAGHGTQAATTMAQLRHSLRALTVTTHDPGVLLGHLNRLTCDLDEETPETAATAIVACFDPARRRLTWAQAGHPPPLLCRGGRTAPLQRPAGPMLGVVEDAEYGCAVLDLQVGDVLLCYTDGLVEHRGRGLDDGLAAVIRTVDEAVAAAPRQPLAELLSRLRRANPDDDTCILAVRPITGETQDLRHFLGATKPRRP
ncbi:SpoIIE family protein phosphatase [Couchioplanes caeruleus]|uniref:Serine/threonine protein phosphatase n=2 Tax=Couchioplanes caeruleus TaxID=56438 RepID=A0A1K0GTV0_9ACTN|nr:SpoIIE family protein phosphatase [Couchioplanes caeruleus]OJF14724.1 serine/threonine protein phosphatase [Couchioplanes caeruleus subsp. caeruleus]